MCNYKKMSIVNLFFDIECFKYFFRVLHEASSSWLKLFRVFRLHPVYINKRQCWYTQKVLDRFR
jgi:hypothetical protein